MPSVNAPVTHDVACAPRHPEPPRDPGRTDNGTGGRPPGQSSEVLDAFTSGEWKATTFIAALRHDGLTEPCVLDGGINGVRFLACVEQALAPTLRPGDIVVMDNLTAHEVAGVRAAIRGAELLYPPPCSPDLSPSGVSRRSIRAPKGTPPAGRGGEQTFAKLQTLLRTAACGTVQGLWSAIGRLTEPFAPDECARCIAHAGYGPSNWEML